jgi:hypothetical protein
MALFGGLGSPHRMVSATAGLSRWFFSICRVLRGGSSRGDAVRCHDRPQERPGMFRKVTLFIVVLGACLTPALAQPPLPPLPFPPLLPMPQGTPEERTACAPDVHKFCEPALPDTMRVLACLQANRSRISTACNRVLVTHGQ